MAPLGMAALLGLLAAQVVTGEDSVLVQRFSQTQFPVGATRMSSQLDNLAGAYTELQSEVEGIKAALDEFRGQRPRPRRWTWAEGLGDEESAPPPRADRPSTFQWVDEGADGAGHYTLAGTEGQVPERGTHYSLSDYPGVAAAGDFPCPMPTRLADVKASLSTATPYSWYAQDAGVYGEPETPPGECTLKGVYHVSRHCTRMVTTGNLDIVVENFDELRSYLKPELVDFLEKLRLAHQNQKNGDTTNTSEYVTDICTKCGMMEQSLQGQRLGSFMLGALSDRRATIQRDSTQIMRTQQSQKGFFDGLREKLPSCRKSRPPCGKFQQGPVLYPLCYGSGGHQNISNFSRYTLARAHTMCQSYTDNKDNVSIPPPEIGEATQAALSNMFTDDAAPETADFQTAADLASTLCAQFASRGSPEDEPNWCDFLDAPYLNAVEESKSDQESQTQGPKGFYAHLGLLLEDLLNFGGVVFASPDELVPVKVLHAHAETVMPLFSLMGLVGKEEFKGNVHCPFMANLRWEYYKCDGVPEAVRWRLNDRAIGGGDPQQPQPWDDVVAQMKDRLNASGWDLGLTGRATPAAFDKLCGAVTCKKM